MENVKVFTEFILILYTEVEVASHVGHDMSSVTVQIRITEMLHRGIEIEHPVHGTSLDGRVVE